MWVRKMITLFILYIMTLIFFDLIVLEWMYINWIILIIVLSIIIWEKLFLRFTTRSQTVQDHPPPVRLVRPCHRAHWQQPDQRQLRRLHQLQHLHPGQGLHGGPRGRQPQARLRQLRQHEGQRDKGFCERGVQQRTGKEEKEHGKHTVMFSCKFRKTNSLKREILQFVLCPLYGDVCPCTG